MLDLFSIKFIVFYSEKKMKNQAILQAFLLIIKILKY